MSKPLVLALILLAGFAGSLRAQSLADVARKEEERRKALPPPTKVYTNKDLVDVPSGSAAGAAADPAKDAAAEKAIDKDLAKAEDKGGDKGGEKKDKAYWFGRLQALQQTLDRDTSFADALQSKINALTTDFVNRDDPAQRAVIERNRIKALAELANLKKSILDDQKAIADFQEEARRASVPPGWLR
jgi:hypothetical protein